VLYKGRSESGFRFFTNYTSRKGQELAGLPLAAAVFYWPDLHRQVRFEGSIEKLSEAESDAYFASRPRDSQLGAWASPQSQPLESGELERRMEAERLRFEGTSVTRPAHWGGYRLVPSSIEFWLPHEHRLNERWLFSRIGDAWERQALAP
jgi:pyridoxamine 5'-phosphate oxidase